MQYLGFQIIPITIPNTFAKTISILPEGNFNTLIISYRNYFLIWTLYTKGYRKWFLGSLCVRVLAILNENDYLRYFENPKVLHKINFKLTVISDEVIRLWSGLGCLIRRRWCCFSRCPRFLHRWVHGSGLWTYRLRAGWSIKLLITPHLVCKALHRWSRSRYDHCKWMIMSFSKETNVLWRYLDQQRRGKNCQPWHDTKRQLIFEFKLR